MTPENRDWLKLLGDAVAATGYQAVADRLEVSRTTVSLALRGKYPGKTDRVADRVMRAFGQVECTHTGQPVSLAVCVSYTNRKAPLNNPLEMKQWRACLACPLRPAKGVTK